MNDVLTIDEMKERYAPDWVLILEPQTDEFQHLRAGDYTRLTPRGNRNPST